MEKGGKHYSQLKERVEPRSVILVHPAYFQVVDAKNPYMVGAIDQLEAMEQWNGLLEVYTALAREGILDRVTVLPGAKDLEDMVFCANQSLPWKDREGRCHVVLSNMRHPSRQREVAHFSDFYSSRGYTLHEVPGDLLMEGMGDSIFHPFRELLWMGNGYRTSAEVAPILEDLLDMPVVPLHLVSEYFYHLDTCFLPIDDRKVLLCREAFDDASCQRIAEVFEEIIEVPRTVATETFCLNTHCIYDRDRPVAVSQPGRHMVHEILEQEGYRIVRTDTSEFMRSGGSVYCMKMMYHD